MSPGLLKLTLEQRIEQIEIALGPPPWQPLHSFVIEKVRETWITSATISLKAGIAIEIDGTTISHRTGNFGDLHTNYAEPANVENITARWLFSSGLTIGTGQTLQFGADVILQRLGANVLGLGSGDEVRSGNFVSGVAGWQIDETGSAEFQNCWVRGELHGSVFVKDLIDARAGTLIVAKSAGVLAVAAVAVASPSTFAIIVADPPGGGFLFEDADICRMKVETASGIGDLWVTVASRTDLGDGTQQYTCTAQSGSDTYTYPAGTPVIDYGTSGDGLLVMTAELSNAPYYDVLTHAGAPWTTVTPRVRLGKLDGVTSPTYGALSGYGLWSDHIYLEGTGHIHGDLMVDGTIKAPKLSIGESIFNAADGLLLLGPSCPISGTYWQTLRGQQAVISGSFQRQAGRWQGTRALAIQEACTQPNDNPLINGTYVGGTAPGCHVGGNWTGCTKAENTNPNYTQYGGKSQKIIFVNTPSLPYWYQHHECAVSTEYTIRVRVYVAAVTTQVQVRITGDVGGNRDTALTTIGWHEVLETITTADPVVGDNIIAYCPNNDAATFYIDVITVEPYDHPSIPFDGDSGPGFTWAGASQGSAPTRAATHVELDEHLHLVNDRTALSIRTVIQMPYAYDGDWPKDDYNFIWDFSDGTNTARLFIYYQESSNTFRVQFKAIPILVAAAGSFAAGDWMDIIVTVDTDADDTNLYLNGVLADNDTTAIAPNTGMDRWNLGEQMGALGYHGNFVFAEYAVFNTVLSFEQIAQMYNLQRALIDMGSTDTPGVYILDGRFRIASSQSGQRVEITAEEIAGYNSAGTKQFYLQASDGAAMAGAGAVVLNAQGVEIYTSGDAEIFEKHYNADITVYTTAFGFMNLQKTDPGANTYGAMNFGMRHNATNQSGIVCWLNEVDIVVQKAGTWRYLLQADYDRVHIESVPLRVANLAAAPASPENGDVYYDTTLNQMRVRENGAWRQM